MSLYCRDGETAVIPPRKAAEPAPRSSAWKPPDVAQDTCQRCGLVAWQHWTVRPERKDPQAA